MNKIKEAALSGANIKKKLKVKGSNQGISILQFGLFQFSKWLRLDKSNNLGILVATKKFRFKYCPEYYLKFL